MSKQYNSATVADWYWTAEDGRVFSSARAQTVKAGDAAFKAWLADETRPTPWPRDEAGAQTDAALQNVLVPYMLAGPLGSPVPEVISDRQFFQQLAIGGDITEDDALAAVTTGTLPKKLSDAIAALPAAKRFAAKMLCAGATEFHRSNPMVPVLGQALGKDAKALDAIWVGGSAL